MKIFFIKDQENCDLLGAVVALGDSGRDEIRAAIDGKRLEDLGDVLPRDCFFMEAEIYNNMIYSNIIL